jgi:hypothetical protein
MHGSHDRPVPDRDELYKQDHREHRALRRNMATMGETLDDLKESLL